MKMKGSGMILGFALLFTKTAQAITNFENGPSGAHYATGFAEPICTVGTDGSVSCPATQIGGVGRTNAFVSLTAIITINGVCHNPGNDNIVEPHSQSIEDSDEASIASTRNGQLMVPVLETGPAVSEFTCPNTRWREEVTSIDVSFLYTLTFDGFPGPFISISGSGP